MDTCINIIFFALCILLAASIPRTARCEDLGVTYTSALHAIIPRTDDGRTNVTVVLHLWLVRIASKPPLGLPHQSRPVVRGFAWADDPADLHSRALGHLAMVVRHSDWQPRLWLETPASPLPVPAVVHMEHNRSAWLAGHSRPYSFSFQLPRAAGACFKLFESSWPGHKVPLCLHPRLGLCASLARPPLAPGPGPGPAAAPPAPALWAVLPPLRNVSLAPGDWEAHFAASAARVAHHVSYHVQHGVGLAGVMLYGDAWSREGLRRQAVLAGLLRTGVLRLVAWEWGERLDEDDGRGRVLGYNYDQALIASHALLGLSRCGAGVRAMVADIDEYLLAPGPPQPAPAGAQNARGLHSGLRAGSGRRMAGWGWASTGGGGGSQVRPSGPMWPRLMSPECLGDAVLRRDGRGGAADADIAVFVLQRYEVASTHVAEGGQGRLWSTCDGECENAAAHVVAAAAAGGSSGRRGGRSDDEHGGGGRGGDLRLASHPLGCYDLVTKHPMRSPHSKNIALPASYVVDFFVHDGHPLHGRTVVVPPACAVLLHVRHLFGARADVNAPGDYVPYVHPLLGRRACSLE